MEPRIARTRGDDPDFLSLLPLLDANLDQRNPGTRGFFGPLNAPKADFRVALAYDGSLPVACGALKAFPNEESLTFELKRMFVREEYRGRGISRRIVAELEAWAKEEGASRIVLETGEAQVEAVGLYHSSGFRRIPNYGEYINSPKSLCMEKRLESR